MLVKIAWDGQQEMHPEFYHLTNSVAGIYMYLSYSTLYNGLMKYLFSVNHHILFSWQPNFQKLLDIAVPGLMLHIFISFMYTFFVSFLPCLGIKVDF